jgi:hypothetical protein
MKKNLMVASASLFACLPAMAALPMGLKCDPSIKIVGAEVGQVRTYEVQKGMQKEMHGALIDRKKVAGPALRRARPCRVLSIGM